MIWTCIQYSKSRLTRGHGYRNCQGMTINMLVEKLCREEEVGFVVLLQGLIYVHEGRASSKWEGAAVFADVLTAAVDSGMGSTTNIFGSKHCLN